MDVLIQYGFSIEEIQYILDTNLEIEEVDDRLIYEFIELLRSIGCRNEHIKNIFICNPFCLTNSILDMKVLLQKLDEYGLDTLYITIDRNPYLLNLTISDLEQLYQTKTKEGMNKEEFIDYLNYQFIY